MIVLLIICLGFSFNVRKISHQIRLWSNVWWLQWTEVNSFPRDTFFRMNSGTIWKTRSNLAWLRHSSPFPITISRCSNLTASCHFKCWPTRYAIFEQTNFYLSIIQHGYYCQLRVELTIELSAFWTKENVCCKLSGKIS